MAVNKLGDALAAGGSTFSSDDDPDLIRDAAPFSLKTMEVLLAENPRHAELRRAAAAGFVQYAFAFVQEEADEKEQADFTASDSLRQRARRLYLRAKRHGMAGLEARHPGFEKRLKSPGSAVAAELRKEDVPLLFWTAAAWAAAVAQSKDQPDLISELPWVQVLIDRALALDEGWNGGAIHGFLINYEMVRPGNGADAGARARRHFERAQQLAHGQLAAPYVSLAESVSVPENNRGEYETLLRKALAVDVDANPDWRLENLVMQRRARWLLGRIDDVFLPTTKQPASTPKN
jgi:predicted anti-sigma-YlaC factor YlaD